MIHGRCPLCNKITAVKADGTTRAHWTPLDSSNLGVARQSSRIPKCPGGVAVPA